MVAVFIYSIYGIDINNLGKDTKEIQELHTPLNTFPELRSLNTDELDKKIGDVPNDVYFFSSASATVEEIKDSAYDTILVNNDKALHKFEIQKINSQYYLVGFVNAEIDNKVDTVSSKNSIFATLYPYSVGENIYSISIPFNEIYTANEELEYLDQTTKIEVLKVGFFYAKKGAPSH